jgi:SAM-dependent methyltransferase
MAEGKGEGRLKLIGRSAEARFYLEHLPQSGPLLVLGCAQGSLAFELAESGRPVLGVDPSRWMIDAAHAEAERTGLDGSLELLVADPRALRLERTFAGVVAPRNALGALGSVADLEAALATVTHHLAQDGVLAFEIAHPGLRVGPGPGPHLAPPPSDRAFTRHLRDRREGPARPGGLHRVRRTAFSAAEVERALAGAGLTLRERYGAFDNRPFEPDDERQLGIAGRD